MKEEMEWSGIIMDGVDSSDDPITWEKLPETDWVVRANSAAIVNDNLYVVGGLNDEGTTNAVQKLNLD